MKNLKVYAKSALSVLAMSMLLVFSSCKDECKDVVCENGGVCVAGICDCVDGYEGTNCETAIRDKFKGTWSVTDDCSLSGPANYIVTVTNGSSILGVSITNFWDEFNGAVNATVSGSTITIPLQEPDADGFKVSGTGTISADGNTITWSYTIDGTAAGSGTDVCNNSTWTK